MAIICPYGDPNAHGSIGDAVTFRRHKGRVIFQKKPFPKQLNSPGQLAQRTAFKNALSGWYALNNYHKDFYNTRGKELQMTGLNLYIKQALLNNLPSTTRLRLRRIIDFNIITTRSINSNGVGWLIRSDPYVVNWWSHWDNSNIMYQSTYDGFEHNSKLIIQPNISPYPLYSFRDGFWFKYHTLSSLNLELLVRIPSVDSTFTKNFYIADDGSTYWDSAMTQLACVSKF